MGEREREFHREVRKWMEGNGWGELVNEVADLSRAHMDSLTLPLTKDN